MREHEKVLAKAKTKNRCNSDFTLVQCYSSTVTAPKFGYSVGTFGRQGSNYYDLHYILWGKNDLVFNDIGIQSLISVKG